MQSKNVEIIYTNSSKNLGGALFILDTELFKEFLKIETDVSQKVFGAQNLNFGFFLKNGHQAMTERRVYSTFFRIENLNKMAPIMMAEVTKVMQRYLEPMLANPEEYVEVNVNQMLRDLFSEIVEKILFGEKMTTSEQCSLSDLIQ